MNEATAWYLGLDREKTAQGALGAAWKGLSKGFRAGRGARKGGQNISEAMGKMISRRGAGASELTGALAGRYAPELAIGAGAAGLGAGGIGAGGYMAGQRSERSKPWHRRLMGT